MYLLIVRVKGRKQRSGGKRFQRKVIAFSYAVSSIFFLSLSLSLSHLSIRDVYDKGMDIIIHLKGWMRINKQRKKNCHFSWSVAMC